MSGKALCGTCKHLNRSTSPGLHTFGKCPHREGWVRTHDEACPHHDSGGSNAFVRWAIAVQVATGAVGLCTSVYFDVRFGKLWTHLALGLACLCLALFIWYVKRTDLLSEDAKYIMFSTDDRPVEKEDDSDDPPWF